MARTGGAGGGESGQAAPVAQRQQHMRTHEALVTATDSLLTYKLNAHPHTMRKSSILISVC